MSAERILHEIVFVELRISYEKFSEIFPEIFEPLFCGSKKSRKIPAKFPSQKIKQIHRRAPVGAQGEQLKTFCDIVRELPSLFLPLTPEDAFSTNKGNSRFPP